MLAARVTAKVEGFLAPSNPSNSTLTDPPLVVYGAGGHGQVVADAARCAGRNVLGFLDDGKPAGTKVALGTVLGGADWWRQHRYTDIVPAIGNNAARLELVLRLETEGATLATVVHPSAVVSTTSRIGPGVVVLALAVVNTGAAVSAGAIVNSGAVVEHDAAIGKCAHVSPNATLGGGAALEDLAHVGVGACILPGVTVGRACVVGAGAVVTRNTPPDSVCMGVPAKVQGA